MWDISWFLKKEELKYAIEELIRHGVDTFYVGHQGHFDNMVLGCLLELKETFKHWNLSVVLAHLPTKKTEYNLYHGCSIYLDGFETVHPKFAVEKRNKWMVAQSNYCLCYVNQSYGGAYKFACLAKRKDLTIMNIGSEKL